MSHSTPARESIRARVNRRTFVRAAALISIILASAAGFVAGQYTHAAPDTSVSSFNDGFTDGMQNAFELGPSGTAAWLGR